MSNTFELKNDTYIEYYRIISHESKNFPTSF